MELVRDETVTDAGRSPSLSALVGEPLATGALIGGRYRINRFVAAGGIEMVPGLRGRPAFGRQPP